VRFDGVIFDLDGTLADTLEDLADSLNRVLTDEGLPVHDCVGVRNMVGNGIRRLVTDSLPPEQRTEEIVARCLDRFIADYGEHCLVKTRLYDGVGQLVIALRADAVRLAVFSNKADEPTRRIVDALIGTSAFEVIIGAQPGIPLKPDPAGALLISTRFGIAPDRVVYLGDSPVDMLTATVAGMVPIGVSWGFRTRDELIDSGARAVLDRPLDLLNLRR
jgi:phosphoglycolate phosphatase